MSDDKLFFKEGDSAEETLNRGRESYKSLQSSHDKNDAKLKKVLAENERLKGVETQHNNQLKFFNDNPQALEAVKKSMSVEPPEEFNPENLAVPGTREYEYNQSIISNQVSKATTTMAAEFDQKFQGMSRESKIKEMAASLPEYKKEAFLEAINSGVNDPEAALKLVDTHVKQTDVLPTPETEHIPTGAAHAGSSGNEAIKGDDPSVALLKDMGHLDEKGVPIIPKQVVN